MGARFLLIDGYNLMHAAGMARSNYGPGDLQRCRERLLRYLAGRLTRAESARATVIFDARDPLVDRPHEQQFAGFRIVFARPEGDADLVIARFLDRHPAPKGVTLVSSDRELQRAARHSGAQWVESDRFLKDLDHRSAKGTERRDETRDARTTEGLSPTEAEAWMRYFGNLNFVEGLAGDFEPEFRPVPPERAPVPEPEPGSAAAGSNTTDGGSVKRTTRRPKPRRRLSAMTEKPDSGTDAQYWSEQFGVIPQIADGQGLPQISQKEVEMWLKEFEDGRER